MNTNAATSVFDWLDELKFNRFHRRLLILASLVAYYPVGVRREGLEEVTAKFRSFSFEGSSTLNDKTKSLLQKRDLDSCPNRPGNQKC